MIGFEEEYKQIHDLTLSGYLQWELVPGFACTYRLKESYCSTREILPTCEIECYRDYILKVGNKRFVLPTDIGKAICDEIKQRRKDKDRIERKALLQSLYD